MVLLLPSAYSNDSQFLFCGQSCDGEVAGRDNLPGQFFEPSFSEVSISKTEYFAKYPILTMYGDCFRALDGTKCKKLRLLVETASQLSLPNDLGCEPMVGLRMRAENHLSMMSNR